MRLLSIKLEGNYKCLRDSEFTFGEDGSLISALIGLNGSGKSQLMELIAEALCFIERDCRPDFQVKHPLPFSLWIEFTDVPEGETTAPAEECARYFQVHLAENGRVAYTTRLANEAWQPCAGNDVHLPRYLVGYSSGNNQNLERPFLKNHLQYNNVIRIRELRHEKLVQAGEDGRLEVEDFYLTRHRGVFPEADDYGHALEADTLPSKAIFVDYDCCTLVLASLSLLQSEELDELLPDVEFRYPRKFTVRYDLRRRSVAQDFYDDIRQFVSVAGEEAVHGEGNWQGERDEYDYDLRFPSAAIHFDLNDPRVLARLRDTYYREPLTLFLKLYRLQLLGARQWQARDKRSLNNDGFFGNVKKPLKTKLPLEVFNVELANGNGLSVSFDDLSDGEAQLITVLGACRIFREEHSLFLFDEPEAHLNPHWRTDFHKLLESAISNPDGPVSHALISTHSPFMISALRKQDVFHFRKNSEPLAVEMSTAEFETYGTSVEVLMKQYFDLQTLMPTTVLDEIRQRLRGNPDAARQWIARELGESMEKAYLLRRLEIQD